MAAFQISKVAWVALSFGAFAGLWVSNASAYCRTTTCDTKSASDKSSPACTKDSSGCTTQGIPIAWKNTCLTYGVQVNGSTRRNITPSQVEPLVDKAFKTWSHAACAAGGTPPLTAQSIGLVECNEPEYNCDSGAYNTNTIMFRDDAWPTVYSETALAITTVTVDTITGEILDADIELNSKSFPFSIGDDKVNNDLLSVLTHEVGHFLGLAHSPLKNATMYASYDTQSTAIRMLSSDDIAGICTIYPPKASDLECGSALQTALDCLPDTACLGGSMTCSAEPMCGQEKTKTAAACAFDVPTRSENQSALWMTLLGGSFVIARRRGRRRSTR